MKKLGCVTGSLLLVACSTMEVISFPPDPVVPEELGQQDFTLLKGGQCPDLNGAYMTPAKKLVVEKGSTLTIESKFSDYFGLFPWSLADDSIDESSMKDVNSDNLRILQSTDDFFLIDLELVSNNKPVEYKFSKVEGDYDCEEGVLRFPERQSFGSIEGSTLNGQVRVSIRSTIDGAMVVLRTHGIYRASSNLDTGEFVHEFYRFESVH